MAFVALDILARVPLLAGLAPGDLERLAERFREHVFEAGSIVVREGARGARVLAFFMIVEGTAAVDVGGERRRTLGPGDHFGEVALFRDSPRTASVTAESELRCLGLSAWEFQEFVREQPEARWALLQTMAARLEESSDPAAAPGPPS